MRVFVNEEMDRRFNFILDEIEKNHPKVWNAAKQNPDGPDYERIFEAVFGASRASDVSVSRIAELIKERMK